MDTAGQARASGAERLAAVLKAPPQAAVLGLDQTPRTFRLGVVTATVPFTVMFNNDPAATIVGLPKLYVPQVGDMVVAGVFDGGGMVVLGTTAPVAPVSASGAPWETAWGVIGGGTETVFRVSSSSSLAGVIVFSPRNFVAVANRFYKLSWHASYVRNTDSGPSQLIVQWSGPAGVIENAVVTVWGGGQIGPLDAFMYGASEAMFTPGATYVQMIATATAPAGFTFQNGGYSSYLLVEDVGPNGPPP